MILALAMLCASAALAQDPSSASSKTRTDDNTGVRGAIQGVKPGKVLKTVKDSGVIRKVDLKARTVTIAANGEDIELSFSQPSGLEQIKTSKKIAKETGKKKINLDELEVGSKVKFEYYTLLGQLMDLIVESTS
jgi:hypothetical protein